MHSKPESPFVLHVREKTIRSTPAPTYLLAERGDKAATYNHLGIAYAMKGDMTQAALNYKQAAALRPQDKGIGRNLEQALRALGQVPPVAPDAVEAGLGLAEVAATGTSGPRAAVAETGVESFYWIE